MQNGSRFYESTWELNKMNRDDIIRMAREAGLLRSGDGWTEPHRWGITEIERFAALVAAAERQACAQIAFNAKTYVKAAAAIRARGEK
jgi:hypothetical protein